MLISHLHRFIYLKTMKTAGTSVEIYFEPYCASPRTTYVPTHGRDAEVTAEGVIGYRGVGGDRHFWYNHMPAALLRERAGEEVWKSYFKFCVIRNPYDKAVSQFWFLLPEDRRIEFRSADFSLVRSAFSEWASPPRCPGLPDIPDRR